MTISRLIARPMLASMFVIGATHALRNSSTLGPKAAPVTARIVPLVRKVAPQVRFPEDPVTLVRINAATQLAFGLSLATGRAPRLSASVLALSLVPTTLAGHPFWQETDKSARTQQQLGFLKNLSVLGGLIIAAVDTDGRPGVAWRARRVAKDTRREARHLAASARREAKLAKAQLT